MRTPLTPEEAARVPDLFAEASALPADQQPGYLERACASSAALRAEVESLLGFGSKLPEFLARPAIGRGLEQLGLGAAGELPTGTLLGEHRVVSLLGIGGMGEVYLAEDTVHGRQVALKLIGQGRVEEVRGRHFRHERKVLAALNHPHIARLYGSGVTPDGRAYLVMEYVEGERLDRFCETRGLGINERLALFRKVCAAVSYAHQNLIVHRDLKPANIRVTPEGEPKLLDPEGTDARSDPTLTMQGAMTPEYASPEQLKSEPITTGADVYSLGVVLYELLCGQRPFAHLKGRRPDELARAVCEEEPPRPSTVAGRTSSALAATAQPVEQIPTTITTAQMRPATLRRRLEGDLDNIVAKALQKELSRRYPSVLALSEDLRRHGEGLPVRARRDTLRYRTGKFVRRHKAGVAAVSLLVLALVGGLVATTWQARLATEQRDRARLAQAKAEAAQKQSDRINRFLQQLLGSASPRKMGKDVKVAQVLDAAGATMDQELAADPGVLAEAHRSLGETYQALALHPQAVKHFEAAASLMRRLYGDEDERTVLAEINQAHALCLTGLFIEPEPLLRRALAALRRQPQPDRAKLARVLRLLSYCLMEMHRTPEAQATLNDGLANAATAWGENSSGYADMLMQAGTLARYDGKFAAAADVFRRTVAIYQKIAPDDPQIVTNELSLCLALLEQHQFDESRAQWSLAMRDCDRILGNNDNRWRKELVFISEVLDFAREDFAKVVAEGPGVLAERTAASPNSDGYVVTARYVLGASLTRTGHAPEGEPLLRQALADYDPAAPAFLLNYGNIETALGDCLLAQRRFPEAEPLLLTGLTDLEKRLGPQDHPIRQARQRLHDFYLAWNKPAEAARYQAGATAQTASTP